MKQRNTNSGRAAVRVLSIPDVGREPNAELVHRTPEMVSRVPSNRLSRSGKLIVLLGVFLFYAMIGVLAAKAVVWFFGNPDASTPSESRVAVEPESSGPIPGKPALAVKPPNNSPTIRTANLRDPIVSEHLRVLLDDSPESTYSRKGLGTHQHEGEWNRVPHDRTAQSITPIRGNNR